MSAINMKAVGAVALIAIIAVAAVAVIVFLPKAPSTEPIKIGLLEPLTGSSSSHGRGGLIGAQIAVEDINEAGGILGRPVVLISEDTEGNPDKAVSAATKLITVDKVDVLIGCVLSSEALAVAEVAADNQIIYINSNPLTNAFTQLVADNYERYKYLFRTQWNGTQWMYGWFEAITDLWDNLTKVSFVTEDLLWAREATLDLEALCNASGIGYQDVLFTPGTTDFTPEIAAVEAFDPDVVLVDLLLATSMTIQKQWWALKPDVIFIGASGCLSDGNAIRDLGAEDTNFTLTYSEYWRINQTSKTVDFYDRFVSYSGFLPFGTAACTHDAIACWADAIGAAGSMDTNAIIHQLEIGTFEGVRGMYTFMANHQAGFIPGVMLQWINCQPTVIWPTELAWGSFQQPPWVTKP